MNALADLADESSRSPETLVCIYQFIWDWPAPALFYHPLFCFPTSLYMDQDSTVGIVTCTAH